MWWLYVPIAFDDFSIVLIIQEEPSGFRSLNDCTRIWKDGRVEQLGWPRVKIHYTLGHPHPDRRRPSRPPPPTAHPCTSTWSPSCPCRSTSAAATAATRDWIHGMWKGEKFTERLTYDMTDPAIIGRAGFGVIDHVGRAVCTRRRRQPAEGWGLFEHGALGRHDPSGFADWLTVAP